MLQIETYRSQQRKSKLCFLWRIKILINTAGYLKPFFLGRRWMNNQWKSNSVWYNTPQAALENSRAYLLRAEITKSHLNNRICQHCGVKTSTVTPPLFITFLISPCRVTSTYQVSSEIYRGFFYQGITLKLGHGMINVTDTHITVTPKANHQRKRNHCFTSTDSAGGGRSIFTPRGISVLWSSSTLPSVVRFAGFRTPFWFLCQSLRYFW